MGDWYCNNCNSYKDSWAERQSYKPNETYRRDIRCYSCDEWELTYTSSQKERYKELVKERTDISGYVEEVERFSTWWSNNIATAVVYYDGYYRVFLLVYDPVYSTNRPAVFPESYDCSYWGECSRGKFSSLSSAKGEASWLRDKLISSGSKYYDNPIIIINPHCDTYKSYYNYVSSPHVARRDVGNADSTHYGVVVIGSGSIPSNLDSHFRPLDIVKVREVSKWTGVRYYHFGIYLGGGEICHFTSEINGVRKVDWREFLKERIGEVCKYHPIIPFKHCDKISRQVAYSVNKFWENRYNLYNRNCEHFANMIGLGINYSEQIEDNKEKINNTISFARGFFATLTFGATIWAYEDVPDNNGKGSTIKLINEINETHDKIGYSSSDHWQAKEIKERYLQEVPPKEYCRIV